MARRGPPSKRSTTLRMPIAFREHWSDELTRWARDVLLVVSPDRSVRFAGESIRRVLGLAPLEVLGRDVADLCHPDDRERFAAAFRACLEHPAENQTVEYRLRRADGQLAHAEAILVNQVANEVVQGVIVTARDITERTRAQDELARRERWFRALADQIHDVVEVIDEAGARRFVSSSVEHLMGYGVDELRERGLAAIVVPEDRPTVDRALAEVRSQPDARAKYAYRVRHHDGSELHVESVAINRLHDEAVRGIIVSTRDLSERLRIELALRESEERYALAARGANDGLWDWDLRRGRVYFSPRWKAMLGCDEAAIGEDPREWLDRVHPDDAARVDREIAEHLAGRTDHYESEHRLLHRDGSYRWMLSRGLAVRGPTGPAVRFAGSQSDITERKVYHPLTRLPNRILLADRLGRALERWRQHPTALPFALLLLDVDRFKNVNESLGHGAGDLLLMALASRLEGAVATRDTVAHLGGDQFAVLLEDVHGPAGATRVASRILDELGAPFPLARQEIFIAASIGIALSGPGYRRPEDLVRDAEAAMHRAKASGGGHFELFDKEMHSQTRARLQIENELRRALQRDELRVVYQPIVEIASGRAVGLEALVRWAHPERGLLAPASFVPVAEETGLISEIGRVVLRSAARDAGAWCGAGLAGQPFTVSVNLSGRQFAQPDLVDDIDRVLAEAELPGCHLKLEITETAIMNDPEAAAVTLRRLKERRIQLAIDDFGTGYSSLSYLHRFPFDTIKIDRSFIEGLAGDATNRAIVSTIVTLAGLLDMQVVAEGIDSAAQADELRALACGFGQGYWFSTPVEPGEVPALLARALPA